MICVCLFYFYLPEGGVKCLFEVCLQSAFVYFVFFFWDLQPRGVRPVETSAA